MNTLDKNFIKELKLAILQSRYYAARLVNTELIKLYFDTGRKISIKTKEQAWGSKVLEQISTELQSELPGLKGFSAGNLKKMRIFANFWDSLIQGELPIGSALPNQLKKDRVEISSALSDQFMSCFFSVSFTHHYIIASKSKSKNESNY